jgi:hypothetical protein
MESVFDAQFQNMRRAFLERGIDVRAALAPHGGVEYLYEADHLLTRSTRDDVDVPGTLDRALPGIEPAEQARSIGPGLRRWSLRGLRGGRLTVPQALARLDREVARDTDVWSRRQKDPVATPVHVFHVAAGRICPAGEPVRPSGDAVEPWPAVRPCSGNADHPVRVGVCDTGLLAGADTAHAWLAGVTGDADPLGPALPTGRALIPEYTGHGTFIAGVVRSMAPDSEVFVSDHFAASGGVLEDEFAAALQVLANRTPRPDVLSLSAGGATREAWEPLGLTTWREQNPDVLLVAAAGNESTDAPFYPAAFDWAIGVGALATDQVHRAWFSNFGPWVDVYALGEGMVNAYATGTYEYQEPPRLPAAQNFDGMARWDGTSFATPLVAGLIAQRIADTGETAAQAAAAVLADARPLDGVGPALVL